MKKQMTADQKHSYITAAGTLEERLDRYREVYPTSGWRAFWEVWGNGSPAQLDYVKQRYGIKKGGKR